MKFWVYFDNGNRSNGKFIKYKNSGFDVSVFQVKLGLVGVILRVQKKKWGQGKIEGTTANRLVEKIV